MSTDLYKKYYTIKITGAHHAPNIWYSNKKGKTFRAELKQSQGVIVFMVNPCHFVYPSDCDVLKTETVLKYQPLTGKGK